MLYKGEEIETEVIWELEDLEREAVPFFAATIVEPTDFLKFNLILNPSLGVRQATCEISGGFGVKKPFESKIIQVDRNGLTTWEIKRPKLLYEYTMMWIFNE
jgi:hypothetical protein